MNEAPSDEELFVAHLATLSSRVSSALAHCGFERLVIHSGTPRYAFLDDQTYPFRVNPHFKWWLPLLDAPDCLLQIEPGRQPILVFHSAADYWHKPASLPSGSWARQFELRPVASWAATRAALPEPDAHTAFIGEPFEGLAELHFAAVNPEALLRRLHEQRVRKTPYELMCLREASRSGALGHRAAHRAYADGGSEYAIHQAFLAGCGLREQELPYQAIVARGANGATLHYQDLERDTRTSAPSLLIDAGSQYRGYASDITRSYTTDEGDFAALLAAMEDVQQSLCAAVRPGIDWRDLHLTAHRLVAEVLRDQGIIRSDPADAVESGLSSVFLPHGLGHLLGLQVHDVAGFAPSPDDPPVPPPAGHASLRLTRVLEPGFVVTMEPGLYFIDLLLEAARSGAHAGAIDWNRVESLRRYGGIRIEDNLVVTAQGHENLTRDAFAATAAKAPKRAKRSSDFLREQVANFPQQDFLCRRRRRRRIGRGNRGLLQLVDALEREEQHEGDDDEIKDALKKHAVLQHDGLAVRAGTDDRAHVTEVHAGERHAERRHDDVFDERGDDLAEGRTDNHADGHVDDIALDGKFLEL